MELFVDRVFDLGGVREAVGAPAWSSASDTSGAGPYSVMHVVGTRRSCSVVARDHYLASLTRLTFN